MYPRSAKKTSLDDLLARRIQLKNWETKKIELLNKAKDDAGVTKTEEEPVGSLVEVQGPQTSSRLNRASLHLPLSSHKVSPCLSPPARPPEEKITYSLYKDMTELPAGLTDGQTSGPESFTLSEVATQTEIHYRYQCCCPICLSTIQYYILILISHQIISYLSTNLARGHQAIE